jgi:predicted glycosyltransferase
MITGIVVVSYHNAEGTSGYVTEQLTRLSDDYRVVVVAVDADETYGRRLAEDCGLAYVKEARQAGGHLRGWCIAAAENLGYARGNNLGVAVLKASGMVFDAYLFSNDDIEIMDADVLGRLWTNMGRDSGTAGIGPRVVGLDGNDQSPHTRYISPWRQMGWKFFAFLRKGHKNSAVYGGNDTHSVAEVSKARLAQRTAVQAMKLAAPKAFVGGKCYWVSGAFMMVRADRFEVVGGFDPRTFLYFEEVILAERFMRHGWHFAFEPSVAVVHYEGGSTTVKSNRRNAIEMESKMLYFREYKHVNAALLRLYRWMEQI